MIYDVHEDYPRQVLNSRFAMPIKRGRSGAVDPGTLRRTHVRFRGRNAYDCRAFPAHKTVTVQNFPLMEELQVSDPKPLDSRPSHAVYVGGAFGRSGGQGKCCML